MRISQKLGKLGTGKAFESAVRHLGRALLTRRLGVRLDPARIIKTIDPDRFETIRKRRATDNPGIAWPKYLNLEKWITENLRRVRELGLDTGFRKHILDIGCGAGYFLYICQWLGHDAVGIDIDDIPMFGEMILMLGLNRVLWRVRPFERLPQFGRKFDLITAFMICFNGHKSPGLWSSNEWRFCLDDLETHLNPGGRICLGFNREDDGTFHNKELQQFFESRGAEIPREGVVLLRGRHRLSKDA